MLDQTEKDELSGLEAGKCLSRQDLVQKTLVTEGGSNKQTEQQDLILETKGNELEVIQDGNDE
jgi:hypothetical protein